LRRKGERERLRGKDESRKDERGKDESGKDEGERK
jgi:hypothetical protein